MTTYSPSLCRACARLRQPSVALTHCEAFPDGIPYEIIGLGADHREPYEGDHGLRFVQADTDAARWMFDEWQRIAELDESNEDLDDDDLDDDDEEYRASFDREQLHHS